MKKGIRNSCDWKLYRCMCLMFLKLIYDSVVCRYVKTSLSRHKEKETRKIFINELNVTKEILV